MSTPGTLEEGIVIGPYKLGKVLGRGGVGAVYDAVHQHLKKHVAIKVLDPSIADEVVRTRFLREGELAAKIRHPHVVDVTDVGEMPAPDGTMISYMVMEYLEGEDLGTLLDRQRPLPIAQVTDIMLPIVAAVGAAHDEGVIHRDLKPENVYLAQTKTGLHPKLLDFGISKVAEAACSSDLTKTSALLGTPYYMSPDQIRGAKYTSAKSDQYSLGVILYECITGRRPFEDENLYNLVLRIVTEAIVPPSKHNPEVPPDFEAVVMRAMQRAPDQRYNDVYQLGEALLPFASDAPRRKWSMTFIR